MVLVKFFHQIPKFLDLKQIFKKFQNFKRKKRFKKFQNFKSFEDFADITVIKRLLIIFFYKPKHTKYKFFTKIRIVRKVTLEINLMSKNYQKLFQILNFFLL